MGSTEHAILSTLDLTKTLSLSSEGATQIKFLKTNAEDLPDRWAKG